MDQIHIYIATSDRDYNERLGQSLALRYPTFQVEVAGEANSNTDLTDANRPYDSFDLLLVDEPYKKTFSASEHIFEKIIGMAEERESASFELGYLYRYAGLSVLASELKLYHGKVSGRSLMGAVSEKTTILGFTSATGGVGKTSLAIGVGLGLCYSKGEKVLYISMEEVESTQSYFHYDGGKFTISDYLYYLFSDKTEKLTSYFDAFLLHSHCGIDTFRPGKGINELRALGRSQMQLFWESITKKNAYPFVILDFPLDTSTLTLELLILCQKLFLIDDGKPTSLLKNQKLLQFLEHQLEEELPQFTRVRNKWTEQQEESLMPYDYYVGVDEDSLQSIDRQVQIRLDRSFGIGVMRIAKEIGE